MAPGSTSIGWFGMRAPTITGADGVERALILQVDNLDKLTSNTVDAQFGAPIFLDLGGRSIRDIAKNAHDQYLIEAGTGDTNDSLKNWALYTWDGNPAHDPQFVNELPTDETGIGAWEGIAEVPDPLVPGSKALLTADSGDSSLGGKSYGQYVTIGQPVAGPAVATGVTATAKPGAIDVKWDKVDGATGYFVTVKDLSGANATDAPKLLGADATSTSFEGLTAGTEYTVHVRSQNVATRSANDAGATATPTQGARTATTTTLELVGGNTSDTLRKLSATVSDPGATGTVQFFNGNSRMQDSTITDVLPDGTRIYRDTFPVVNGKAEINVGDQISAGVVSLQAKYTTSNPENFLSSDSDVVSQFIDYRPMVTGAKIVSITATAMSAAA